MKKEWPIVGNNVGITYGIMDGLTSLYRQIVSTGQGQDDSGIGSSKIYLWKEL